MKISWVASLALVGIVACGGNDDGTGGSGTTSSSTGGVTGPNLSCIGNVMLTPVGAAQGALTLTFSGELGSTAGPIGTAHVVACAKDDMLCGMSLAAGDTAADGTVTLNVPFATDGFDGYTLATKQGYFTMVNHSATPLAPGGANSFGMMEQTAAEAFFKQGFSDALDGGMGEVIVDAEDCDGKPAEGLVVTITTAAKIVYMQGTKLAPAAMQTDASGVAVTVNVAPGVVTATSRVASSGAMVSSGAVLVKGGAVSEIHLTPTP